ncbi:MAG: GNAT family N-acetyltransferase [Propionibacteriaceae bacterium]|jgi:ribosomal protein S18 acetylase RimI-like enzyme|nr:GNAT family N-acetyltransferase [Propionibacteriaceae bacterium]
MTVILAPAPSSGRPEPPAAPLAAPPVAPPVAPLPGSAADSSPPWLRRRDLGGGVHLRQAWPQEYPEAEDLLVAAFTTGCWVSPDYQRGLRGLERRAPRFHIWVAVEPRTPDRRTTDQQLPVSGQQLLVSGQQLSDSGQRLLISGQQSDRQSSGSGQQTLGSGQQSFGLGQQSSGPGQQSSVSGPQTLGLGQQSFGSDQQLPGPGQRLLGIMLTPRVEHLRSENFSFSILAVHPAARGRRLGDALVRQALDLARAHGFREVEIHSSEQMSAAHRLYYRFGFVRRIEDETIFVSPLERLMTLTYRLPDPLPPEAALIVPASLVELPVFGPFDPPPLDRSGWPEPPPGRIDAAGAYVVTGPRHDSVAARRDSFAAALGVAAERRGNLAAQITSEQITADLWDGAHSVLWSSRPAARQAALGLFYARLDSLDARLADQGPFLHGPAPQADDALLLAVLVTYDFGWRAGFPPAAGAVAHWPRLWDYARRLWARVRVAAEALSAGALSGGVLPDVALSDGALPDVALSAETFPAGVLSDGALLDVSLSGGVLPAGALSAGVLSDGALLDVSLSDEVLSAWSLPDGTVGPWGALPPNLFWDDLRAGWLTPVAAGGDPPRPRPGGVEPTPYTGDLPPATPAARRALRRLRAAAAGIGSGDPYARRLRQDLFDGAWRLAQGAPALTQTALRRQFWARLAWLEQGSGPRSGSPSRLGSPPRIKSSSRLRSQPHPGSGLRPGLRSGSRLRSEAGDRLLRLGLTHFDVLRRVFPPIDPGLDDFPGLAAIPSTVRNPI